MPAGSSLDVPSALISQYSHIGSGKDNDVLFRPENGISQNDYRDALSVSDDATDTPRSLYVHLPFCPVRCLNCDNNTVITHDTEPVDRYLDTLEQELDLLTDTTGTARQLQQLHLGGGSPNYLNDRQLVRLMAIVDEHFCIDEDTELSMDANPRRCSPSQLALLRNLGFERVFFGIRELDPQVQLAIGRTTSLDMVRDVFETAREAGFRTIGVDVMYGLPCQTEDGLKRTVDNLLALSPDRIACVAFTRKATERVHQAAIDRCAVPSLADKLVLFNALVQGLTADYHWIGLDNFAKPDDELAIAQAEHRLNRSWLGYSHLPPTDLFGVGTNAISDFKDLCVQNHLTLDPWHQSVGLGAFPIRGGIRLSTQQKLQRDAIRELVCNMELEDYSPLMACDESDEATWTGYAEDGLLSITSESMLLTHEGLYLLPHLLASRAASPLHTLT